MTSVPQGITCTSCYFLESVAMGRSILSLHYILLLLVRRESGKFTQEILLRVNWLYVVQNLTRPPLQRESVARARLIKTEEKKAWYSKHSRFIC